MRSWLSHPACLVAAGILSVASAGHLHAQNFAAPLLDVGKGRIEFPAKSILAGTNPFARPVPPNGVPTQAILAEGNPFGFPGPPNGPRFPSPPVQPTSAELDQGKFSIEGPTKSILAGAAAPAVPAPPPPAASAPADRGKRTIELPAKEVLAATAPAVPAAPPVADNPKVEPGKVRWHATFAEAQKASLHSGKPVLLFQMLGRLDDRFC